MDLTVEYYHGALISAQELLILRLRQRVAHCCIRYWHAEALMHFPCIFMRNKDEEYVIVSIDLGRFIRISIPMRSTRADSEFRPGESGQVRAVPRKVMMRLRIRIASVISYYQIRV